MSVLTPEEQDVVSAPPTQGRPSLQRVRIGGLSPELVTHIVSAIAGSLALTWLTYERLLPLHGAVGFWLTWYAVFLVLLAAVSATTLDRLAVVDRIVGALVTTAGDHARTGCCFSQAITSPACLSGGNTG